MKISKTFLSLAALASLAAFPAANAQDVTCENANFSDEVLATFGSIRNSCTRIVDMAGSPHAVLKGVVMRTMGPKVTIQFERDGGEGLTNPYTFSPPDGFIFTVDDDRKQVGVRDLTESTKLNVYVPVSGPIGRLGFTVDPATGEVTYFELDKE
jgi:hypothetical protein